MPHWIDINDQLPNHRQNILVYTIKKAQVVVIFIDNVKMAAFLKEQNVPIEMPRATGYSFCSQEVSGNELHGITHWMPLPDEPYDI